jgi:hypothetical protein
MLRNRPWIEISKYRRRKSFVDDLTERLEVRVHLGFALQREGLVSVGFSGGRTAGIVPLSFGYIVSAYCPSPYGS